MTAEEFKEKFNLRYNNALGEAPGLDDFEISSYLTIAQEELVKEYYDIDLDPRSSFELKERSRRILNELVKSETITSSVSSSRGLSQDSKFFELENDPMFIVLETYKIKSLDSVYNNKVIEVLPITHDEFMRSYRNPFRKPNKNKAWRVDLSRENSKTLVEIISPEDFHEYKVRFISFPLPIIVTNLATDDEFVGMNLSINGKTSKSTSKLNEQVHSEIVDRAVELAALDYSKGTDLQSRVALNKRI